MKPIQVEEVTVETVKPSTPTPHHLRRHDLSFFDQIEASIYMNAIVYYSSDPSKSRLHASNTLKTSLAEILSIYYPLAGRMAENKLYIDCHDQGVLYRETNVKGSLNEFMSELESSEMSKLLSYDHIDMTAVGMLPLFVVQTNFFECGGLAMGLLMFHQVGDALSFFTFINNWASVARRNDDKVHFELPDFHLAAKLFPSVDLNGFQSAYHTVTKEDRVSRMFVFSNEAIINICKKFSTSQKHDEFERKPSRIETLSTFIWKRYIASTQSVQPNKTYRLILAVNLRSRFDPPLPPSVFGNLADVAIAIDTSPNEGDLSKLIKSIRTSLLDLSDPENKKLYGNGVQLLPVLQETYEWMNIENEVWICFSSVARLFHVRHVDFGWGAPLAMNVCVPRMFRKNMVCFMETADENGIEAWVSFNKEDMSKFEVDPVLLTHATPP